MKCLVLFGASGCGVAQSVLYAACAGAWSGETDVLLVVNGAAKQQAERTSLLYARYERIRARMEALPGERLGFTAPLHLHTWPDALPYPDLNTWAAQGDDALLRKALFTETESALPLDGDLDACPEAARALFAALTKDGLPLSDYERIALVGSLDDGWAAAGVDAFARALAGREVASVLLEPYAGTNEHAHKRSEAALARTFVDQTCYLLGLTESDCSSADPAASNLVVWLAAACCDNYFRAETAPTGLLTYRAAAGKLGWETFPAAFRLCYGALMKASTAFRLTFQPVIHRGLTAPKWLRDKLIGWYASYFRSAQHMTDEARQQEFRDLDDIAALMDGYTARMSELLRNLPPLLRSSGAMEQARAEAAANYKQYLETAGQLIVMRKEAEDSGLLAEKTVHRHDLSDTEAEKMQKLFHQMEAKKQALFTRQQELDRRMGGAAQLLMMKEAQNAWRDESERLHLQRAEAERRIQEATQVASLEEQHLIATARTKLQRLERYLSQVDACWMLVKSERRRAKEEGVRRLPPEIAMDDSLPESGLFDPLAMEKLLSAKPDNKKLLAEAESAWPALLLPQKGDEMSLADLAARLKTKEDHAMPVIALLRDMTLTIAKEVR